MLLSPLHLMHVGYKNNACDYGISCMYITGFDHTHTHTHMRALCLLQDRDPAAVNNATVTMVQALLQMLRSPTHIPRRGTGCQMVVLFLFSRVWFSQHLGIYRKLSRKHREFPCLSSQPLLTFYMSVVYPLYECISTHMLTKVHSSH